MKFKKLFDNILFYISVPKCVSCGIRIRKSDFCFCETCKKEYNNAKLTDCSKCAKLISECDCSTKYLKAHYIHKIFKVYRYVPNTELASNQIIYRLKRENRSDIREFLTDELTESIRNKSIDLTNCMITNIPRRRSSVKKYGFDHTRELAKILSKRLGVPYVQILRSTSKHDQKKSKSREDRLSNASFEYKKKIPFLPNRGQSPASLMLLFN